MDYSSVVGMKISSCSRSVSVEFEARASSSAVGGGSHVETRRWVRERAREARVKRREERSGVDIKWVVGLLETSSCNTNPG